MGRCVGQPALDPLDLSIVIRFVFAHVEPLAIIVRRSPNPVIIPYRGQALGARYHVQTALLYAIETSMIEAGQNPEVLEVKFYDGR